MEHINNQQIREHKEYLVEQARLVLENAKTIKQSASEQYLLAQENLLKVEALTDADCNKILTDGIQLIELKQKSMQITQTLPSGLAITANQQSEIQEIRNEGKHEIPEFVKDNMETLVRIHMSVPTQEHSNILAVMQTLQEYARLVKLLSETE